MSLPRSRHVASNILTAPTRYLFAQCDWVDNDGTHSCPQPPGDGHPHPQILAAHLTASLSWQWRPSPQALASWRWWPSLRISTLMHHHQWQVSFFLYLWSFFFNIARWWRPLALRNNYKDGHTKLQPCHTTRWWPHQPYVGKSYATQVTCWSGMTR